MSQETTVYNRRKFLAGGVGAALAAAPNTIADPPRMNGL